MTSGNFLLSLAKFLANRRQKDRSSDCEHKEEDLKEITAQEQKQFSRAVLAAATQDFHPKQKLGEGGFGPVYKGKLEDGSEIAVKKLSKGSKQGGREFAAEARLLSRVQHRNVVNLLGYCSQGTEKLLVYEYLANESLDKFIFDGQRRGELNWRRRYEVILGVARGLLYLHEGSQCCIIHRDIKTSNILLDHKWIPKIADFGMARLFPEDQLHVNTRVAGTNGYMAPEYAMHGQLSVKADVYSFGVVILELISGRRNFTFKNEADVQNLLHWAWKLNKKGQALEMVDSTLLSTEVADQISMCIQIGLLCVQSDPKLRPTMRRVVVLLSKKPGTSLPEPSRPGLPGERYRRSLKHHARDHLSLSSTNQITPRTVVTES